MMDSNIIAIVGPTATGKSGLALHLAQAFGGEVVNGDSRQVYRSMDIGTAKPSVAERRLVPHHLVDILDPDSPFDLATFLDLARSAIKEIGERGRLPIVVGGTGQYMQALLEGWQVPPVPPAPDLRAALEEEARMLGPEALHRRLAQVDPEAAQRIHSHNVRRVVRALELHHVVGPPGPEPRRKSPPPFRSLVIGLALERKALYRRIDARVEEMMARGLVEEVQGLFQMGYSEELPAFSSVGYREVALHLRGQLSLADAVQKMKVATHRFARHQHAWFQRDDPRIHWLDAKPDPLPQTKVLVQEFLAGDLPYDTMASARVKGGS